MNGGGFGTGVGAFDDVHSRRTRLVDRRRIPSLVAPAVTQLSKRARRTGTPEHTAHTPFQLSKQTTLTSPVTGTALCESLRANARPVGQARVVTGGQRRAAIPWGVDGSWKSRRRFDGSCRKADAMSIAMGTLWSMLPQRRASHRSSFPRRSPARAPPPTPTRTELASALAARRPACAQSRSASGSGIGYGERRHVARLAPPCTYRTCTRYRATDRGQS